jgi:site-specific DNA-methyltransferase (adenine-specific)
METILNSDCTEGLIDMDDNSVDLCLIDPPYFDYKSGHRKDKDSKLSKGIVQQSREDQIRVIRECIRILKPDRAFFVFTNWENIYWMQEPFQSFFQNMIIWDKGNWTAGNLSGSFGNQYEVILLGAKGKGWKYSGKRLSDIWAIPRMGTNRVHTTEKPVALYSEIIENCTQPGAFIVDPYLGSGASVEAAMRLGRHIMGYEIDKEYYDVIVNRVANVRKELSNAS